MSLGCWSSMPLPQHPNFKVTPSCTHLNPAPSPSWGWQVPPLAQGLEEQPSRATSQSLPWEQRERWERGGGRGTAPCPPPAAAGVQSPRAVTPHGAGTCPPQLGTPGPCYLVAGGAGAAVGAERVVVAGALVLAGAGEAGVALGLDAQGWGPCGEGSGDVAVLGWSPGICPQQGDRSSPI